MEQFGFVAFKRKMRNAGRAVRGTHRAFFVALIALTTFSENKNSSDIHKVNE